MKQDIEEAFVRKVKQKPRDSVLDELTTFLDNEDQKLLQ